MSKLESLFGNRNNEELKKREIENGHITYRTLAEYVGDMVLCNNIQSRLYETMELESGDDIEYFDENWNEISREEYEELENNGKIVNEQPIDIYQYYIISGSGADFLQNFSNEIVYYDSELDIYVWGITHFGTSWDYVFTDIPVKK